jgi:hypothetical protein
VSVSTNVAPLAPLDFRARVVGNAVSLQWSENPLGMAPTGYVVRAGSGPGLSDVAVLQLPATARSFAVVAPTGTYFVRLAAFNSFGASPEAGELELSPGPGACSPRLPAPTGLVATTASGQVTLSWNAVSGAVGYELIAGSMAGGSDVGRFSLPPNPSITASAPARQYFVRRAAISSAGCASNPSGEISFIVP